ncbi:hypothetical protein NQZ68_017384 [Dissostichus eleginoides]|nr:hypothetical protein NQZ68_017384 [Dissostichus eleginoides]
MPRGSRGEAEDRLHDEYSAPLDAIIESTWLAGKLLCEHSTEKCGPASPLSTMLLAHLLGLTIKS